MADLVDVSKLRAQLEQRCKELHVRAQTEETPKGTRYRIRTEEAVLDVYLGEEWAGYELAIDKQVLGRAIGTAEDTDNYPLHNEYTPVTMAIFNGALRCLEQLRQGAILIGVLDGKPVLAIPTAENKYKVIKAGRFVTSSSEVPRKEFGRTTQLRPLR